MDKFKNKFRIPSARLKTWDYNKKGSYFITICTKNKLHFFGEIFNGEMQLNEMGKLAEQFWTEIPIKFRFIELGNFIIMPNHVHGILIINKSPLDTNFPVETRFIASPSPIASPIQPTIQPPPPTKAGGCTGDKNPMFQENISRICRWYKGRTSFEIRKTDVTFQWQPRFHDHIIRDAASFDFIQKYIANNPRNWEKDKFNV